MRRGLLVLLSVLAVAGPAAWATGFGGDAPPARIPIPASDWRVEVEDHGGTVIEVTRATFNGEVFVYGTLGAAQVTVPFENISEVRFEAASADDKRVAVIRDAAGGELKITVDDDIPCYGRTSFGNVRIDVRDLRRLTIRGPVPEAAPE